MKKFAIERRLIAARPQIYASNRHFTDSVMEKITKNEILTPAIRNMSVPKKETFMMKLRHLPKLAIFAIAIGLVLLLSGTAYATYQLLWGRPSVQLTELTTSTSGRQEVVLAMKECGSSDAQRYELKKGATISADRIPAIVQAQCELQAINRWAQTTYGESGPPSLEPIDGEPFDQLTVRVSMATRMETIKEGSVTFAANDRYGQPTETHSVSPAVTYIVDGKESSAEAIRPGDAVVYVVTAKFHLTMNEAGVYTGGDMPEQTLVAIVKLSMPYDDYDQFAWQSLTEKTSCYGNTDDLCLTGYSGEVDIYMRSDNQDINGEMTVTKEIQGVITQINGRTFTLQSSSGSLFTVTLPTDALADFNQNRSANYNGLKVVVGSTISVRYIEKESEHSKTISADSVFWVTLKLEIVSKGDPIKAY